MKSICCFFPGVFFSRQSSVTWPHGRGLQLWGKSDLYFPVMGFRRDLLLLNFCTTAGPSLVHIFISDLNKWMESTLSKFADDTKLERVSDTPEGCTAIKQNLGRLES